MKVIFKTSVFREALRTVSSVIPSKSTVPIIQNVKITATSKQVEISGTDLEVGMTYFLEDGFDLQKEGTLLLPAQKLNAILEEWSENEMTVEADAFSAVLKSPDSYFKVVGADPIDYPNFPPFDEKKAIELEARDVARMIKKTAFAAATTVSSYVLSGLLVSLQDGELHIVASDGARLALIKQKIKKKGGENIKVIIPTKGIQAIERVLTEQRSASSTEEVPLKMVVEENQVKVRTPRTLLFSRLIEGNYPEYEQVIPKGVDKIIPLDIARFHSAVRKASVFAGESKSKAVRLNFAKNKIVLSSASLGMGESKVDLEVAYTGEAFEVSFNPLFFEEALKVLDLDTPATLEFKDVSTACLLKQGKEFIYLIMPLSLES